MHTYTNINITLRTFGWVPSSMTCIFDVTCPALMLCNQENKILSL